MISKISATMKTVLAKVLKKVAPPLKITGSEWATLYRRYSSLGPSPGRHNNDRAPFAVEPLNSATDRLTEEVTCLWSSQVGKTTLAENVVGYYASEDPGPMMMVCARVEDAEDFSKDRLMPMVRESPRLKEVFGDEKQKSSGSTILKKIIMGGIGFFKLAGANSPASLAMRAIRVLIMDEKDRYPASAGSEGRPAALARKRTATFHNRKIINISSPGIRGHSEIEADYERSDKRQYYIQCPHCHENIILKHEQLKCENNDPETTIYICQLCDVIIEEADKPQLMRDTGKWIAEKPFAGHAGFKLTEMYSPFRKWAEIKKDEIEAQGDPERMKVFINTSKAETWEIQGEQMDWEVLYGRREAYEIGKIPLGGLFLTAAVDVQKNRLEVEVKAWGRGKENWSIVHEVIIGDTAGEKVWKDLADFLENSFEHECGTTLPIKLMAVDSGYRTTHVYAFTRKYPQSRVIAVKGKAKQTAIVSPPKSLDVQKSGKKAKKSVKVWHIGVDILKDELFGNLAKEPPDEELRLAGERYPAGYCHYPEYKEEFFKQLTAEILAPRKGKGANKQWDIVHEWVKIAERNEAIDLHVYNRAAANVIGIDRFKDHNWKAMEEALGVEAVIPAEVKVDSTEGEKPKREKKKKREKIIIKGSGFLDR